MPASKNRSRTLYADDCLNVLTDEQELPTGSVDLIYLDPPFNSNSNYNLPFKGAKKDIRPVEAFKDTWTWGEKEEELLQEFRGGGRYGMNLLASIIDVASALDKNVRSQHSMSAYLVNMTVRLMAMRRVLKDRGSIYLHCDPTASHFLKLVMDGVFGKENFQNEIIWRYRRWPAKQRRFQRMHDVIFMYTKNSNDDYTFNKLYEELAASTQETFGTKQQVADFSTGSRRPSQTDKESPGAPMSDVWDIGIIAPIAKERLGYPTQKPLKLLRRILKASSNPGDVVLDPFCGCGTTVHAAEELGRRWIGIDISSFSVGLIKGRIRSTFKNLSDQDIVRKGVPVDVDEVLELAKQPGGPFEVEKWAVSELGGQGMGKLPGQPGPDGGVDGYLLLTPFRLGKKAKRELAIIQVKSGKVTPDAVGRLYNTVSNYKATAGVMVCFEEYMGTVNRERVKKYFADDFGKYPVIQGFSFEDLLQGKIPKLPLPGRRVDGRMSALPTDLALPEIDE